MFKFNALQLIICSHQDKYLVHDQLLGLSLIKQNYLIHVQPLWFKSLNTQTIHRDYPLTQAVN